MVKDGARWDFKDQIKKGSYGPGTSIQLCSDEKCDWYEYSMAGNIFYAYMGELLDSVNLKSEQGLYTLNKPIPRMFR